MADIHIYKQYLEVKENNGRIGDILTDFNISRGTLYNIIRRVQVGNTNALRRCMKVGRLECLWEHKYGLRFSALPDNRAGKTVAELQKIIWGMKKDGFPVHLIAKKLKKERSTILYHLAKQK